MAEESSDVKMCEEDADKVCQAQAKILPGNALVKAEYLDPHHKRHFEEQYLPKDAAAEIKQTAERKHQAPDEDQDGEQRAPGKKAKLKGRNKKRPIEKRPDAADKMCPGLLSEDGCNFGSACRFNHDKESFMKSKPEDIAAECYVFKTFGKCKYGITCRYSKHHTTDELNNVVNEDLYEKTKDAKTSYNILPKEQQRLLWKRKYDFNKANTTYKQVQAEHEKRVKEQEKARKMLEAQKKENSTATQGAVGMAMDIVDEADPVPNAAATNCTVDKVDTAIPPTEETCEKQANNGDYDVKFLPDSKKKIDFSGKLYLAPLTTVGNLPFRRVCKQLGADITCSEMSLATHLLQGQQSEWALLRRHASEDLFGIQLCGAYPDTMTRCTQLLSENAEADFIDINCGCPIDLIFKKGEGSALMARTGRFEQIIHSMTQVSDIPITVKVRTGIYQDKNIAHNLIPKLRDWGASLVTLHGRSREQRYTKFADWDYIDRCAKAGNPMPVFGNGDILSYEDYFAHLENTNVSGSMIARGALIKPWIFTEIKERRHWDISASERFEYLQKYANYGMEHWGSDRQGVSTTRRFLLEWLSFLHRYIPVGLLERPPQKMNEKPPYYIGRNDLETLLASPNCADWIKISEMLLGPVSDGFNFLPKHKANAYQ